MNQRLQILTKGKAMKDATQYAKQIDSDFQDENYFKNIVPRWFGQEYDMQATEGEVPELPEGFRLINEEIPPIEDAADGEEFSEPETTVFACCDDSDTDNIDPGDSCGADVDSSDFDDMQEDLCDGPYTYWGYEDEPEYEELCDDDADEAVILQEVFCDADGAARSDDEGWYYED
jgi:hypothetical protein